MLDHECVSMRVDGRGDVLACQPLADEVGLSVDVDQAMIIDFADERHVPARKRQLELGTSISVGVQAKAVGQARQVRALQLKPLAGQAGGIALELQGSMRLVEVVVAKEGSVGTSERSQIEARVLQYALLPQVVEAFDVRIAPRLAFGDEYQVHPPTASAAA